MSTALRDPGAAFEEAVRLHRSGAAGLAEGLYRELLAAGGPFPEAWHMLAIALWQQGRLDEAAQAAERATAQERRQAAFWLTRGSIEAARQQPREAQEHLRRATRLAPERAEAHYHLGRSLLAQDRWGEALAAYQQAFERDPAGALDRRELLLRLGSVELPLLPDFWHGEFLRFFERDDVDRSRYAIAALRLLMKRPAFALVRADAEGRAGQAALDEVMADALFGRVLRDALVAQAEFEQMLTKIRARLLLDPELRARAPLAFLCHLALQCFNNEFVFAESAAEQEALAAHAQQIEADLLGGHALDDEQLMRQVATLALYRRLADVEAVVALQRPPVLAPAFEELLRRTVDDLAEERRLRTVIPVLGPSSDAVSRAVRAQYEENPYPRWLSFDRLPPVGIAQWLAWEVPGLAAPERFPAPFQMLVAGCGTGVETLGCASWIRDARVTAVDLSLASLAYGKRMAARLGITNVDFHQADILELGALPQRFDLIYCVGVLMAMGEPRAGLRVLHGLLRPGGLLKLGLYSRRARVAVNVARDLIGQRGLPATPAAMREFRQEVFQAEPDSPLKSLLRWRDFYSMSDCRDMLFHVQEHQFDLPEVEAMAREQGLEVLGMSRQLPQHALAAYRATFPGEVVSADPGRWFEVEERFPETFIGMYQVWLRKPEAGH